MTKKRNPSKKASNIQESYFDAERILDEKKVGGKWLYLIKWSGHDRNGKPWSPDWQPKDNCTAMLLKEWEQEKARLRKKQEQKDKENHKESNQDVVQDDDPMDLQDNNNSNNNNNNNNTSNKAESNNPYSIMERGDKINGVDGLKYVLDKYCQNMSEDIRRKTLSFARYEDCDQISNSNSNSNIDTNTNSNNTNSNTNSNLNSNNLISNSNLKNNIKPNLHSFHVKINSKFTNYTGAPRNTKSSSKIMKNFPSSKVKLVKISPIQPSIISNSPIKSNISILDPNNNNAHKYIRGKKVPLPSKSERLSLYCLNKRSLDSVQDPNNDSATKRQKTEELHDMIRKDNIVINSSINANEKVKDPKDAKDSKDSKDAKDSKDSKDAKDSKDSKDKKDSKDAKDAEILPISTSLDVSLDVKVKKISSDLSTSQSNKTPLDDNLSNSRNIQTYEQFFNQSRIHLETIQSEKSKSETIHINSETIKSQISDTLNKNPSSSSSKFRPIAAKITSSPLPSSSSPSPPQHNSTSSSKSSSKSNSTSSNTSTSSTTSSTSSSTTSSTSSSTSNNTSSASSTGKWTDNSIPSSSSNRHSSRLANIRNNSVPTAPKNNKIVPILTTPHKSYFHKSYIQPISPDEEDPITISSDIQSNQSMLTSPVLTSPVLTTSPQSMSPTIMQTNERSNQQQSSNLNNTNTGSLILENNDSGLSFDPIQRMKELSYELVKVRSYNESLEKQKADLIKEKNKYAKETYQLRVEVDRRPWSNSEASDTIRKCQDNAQKFYNKLVESQNKYVVRCNEYKKLDMEHSRLQNEYNQVKRIMLGKQSEVEKLKEDLNNANQELKKLKEENNNIKKNSVILMQDDYQKFIRLQNSLQELIDQRSNINKDINKLRETINQEVVKMRRINSHDENGLNRQIEILKMQNKLQETSLRMAEESSTIAEESAKLIFEIKKLNTEEILKNYDSSSISNISSQPNLANLLRERISSSLQNQNRDIQSEDSTQRMEILPTETNSSHGLSTIPSFTSLPNNNYHDTRVVENPNAFRNSTTFVRGNTNLRKLPTTTTNSTRIGQSKSSTPRLSSTSSVSTGRKFKVTVIPASPVKSFQKMNYFCEWNLCKRSFNDRLELKKHLKEDHLNPEENSTMKHKNADDLAEVKIEV